MPALLLAIIFWYNTWQLCLVGFLGSPGRDNQTTSRTINLLSTNFWITDGGSPEWRVVLEVVPSIPRAGGLVNFWMTLCRPNFFSIWNQIYRKDLPLKIFPDKNLTFHKPDPLFSKKFDQAKNDRPWKNFLPKILNIQNWPVILDDKSSKIDYKNGRKQVLF